MTRDETKSILMVIESAYPSYKPEDLSMAVDTWYMMLGEYSYQAVYQAVKACIASSKDKFAPSIGEIIDKIHVIKKPNDDNGMEAWSLVMKAIQRGAYNAQEAYDNLPPLVQKAIGSPENIHRMAIDEGFNAGVEESQFLKEYRRLASRQAEFEKYPADVRRLMESTINELEDKNRER